MTVLVVEDFAIYRAMLRQVCLKQCGAARVLEATALEEARTLLAAEPVDLMLLDLDLPDGDGLELAMELGRRSSRPGIVIISAHCEDYTLIRVEQSGAQGFVDKRTGGVATIREAVQAVKTGGRYLAPSLAERRRAMDDDPACFMKVLEAEELEILGLIGRTLDDAEIGEALELKPEAVALHRSAIMQKLAIADTLQLIRFALDKAITPWPRLGPEDVAGPPTDRAHRSS